MQAIIQQLPDQLNKFREAQIADPTCSQVMTYNGHWTCHQRGVSKYCLSLGNQMFGAVVGSSVAK